MGYLKDITNAVIDKDLIFVGVGIIIADEENRVLMAVRTDNNEWSLPGGSLELNETLQECCVRELMEECGIQTKEECLRLNHVTTLNKPVNKDGRNIHVVSVTYVAEDYDLSDMQLDSREFTRYSWFSEEEYLKISSVTEYSKLALDVYFKQTS